MTLTSDKNWWMLFSKETACFKVLDFPLLEVSKQRLHAVKAADIVVVDSHSGLDDLQVTSNPYILEIKVPC